MNNNKLIEHLNEIEDLTKNVGECINVIKEFNCDESILVILNSSLKRLRNMCCKGYEIQCQIVKVISIVFPLIEDIQNNILKMFNAEQIANLNLVFWQLTANLTVNNAQNQQIIWENYANKIKSYLNVISNCTDVQLMIIYNIMKGQSIFVDQKEIFCLLLNIWSNILELKNEEKFEFLHIFFEEYLCNISRRIVAIYATLEVEQRIVALKYVATYVSSGSPNGPIQKILMEFLSKEFKKKSDCVLRVNDEQLNKIHPCEVLSLIEVISIASGDALYSHVYENDHSLFLNAGGLLHTINELGKTSKNIFTPMEKLNEVAPSSKINTSFESEISFQFRTYLVRTLANLLYKNKKNQEYVRELNIIQAILDSTRVDARNPLIKEWSILAIRNLCENCQENQQIISNLTKVGNAPNEMLTELNMEIGSLRISPKA